MTLLGGDDEQPRPTLGQAFRAFAVGVQPLADALTSIGHGWRDVGYHAVVSGDGAITAAGGWCAPSSTYYGTFTGQSIEVTIGNVSPEVIAILTGRPEEETLL